MRKAMLFLVLLLAVSLLQGFELPVSRQPVLEESNLISDFVRVDPDDSIPEKLPTKAWLWQDDNNLMIHFECEIDESFTVGYPAERDANAGADMLRVQLNTLADEPFAYVFLAYPGGNLGDGVRHRDMSIDYQWDSQYSYRTSHTDSTWSVTYTIPLGSLRFKKGAPYHWKVILTRYHRVGEETYSSPYANTDHKQSYFDCMHAITLTHPIKRDSKIKLKPYYVKSYDLINRTSSFDPDMLGLDIALNPTQQTRIKVSLNPDFSDVPPDAATDIYNIDKPFLPDENRFFFIEDIDAFGLSYGAYESRNINQPSFAYKGTGIIGKTKWGILGALDKEITQDGYVINDDDYFQVLSFTSNISKFTLTNAMVSRLNKGYYNHLYNGIFQYQIYKYMDLYASVIGSIKRDDYALDTSIKKGYIASATLRFYPGRFVFMTSYDKRSKDVYADAGYLYYKDLQAYSITSEWYSKPMYGFLKQASCFASVDGMDWYHEGGTDSTLQYFGKLSLDFKPELNTTFRAQAGNIYDSLHREHYTYSLNNSIAYSRWNAFRPSVYFSHSHTMVYALDDTYDLNSFYVTTAGTIAKKYSYYLYWALMDYDYPNENIVDYGVPYTIYLDDRYSIVNARIQFMPNLKLSFTTGLSYSSYETLDYYPQLGYYANLRYEFKRDWFFYAGFKSAQTRDVAPTDNDYLGHFTKDSASAYVKIAVSL
ncbi:MAG: hypothetical protein ACOYIS_07405 [Candidatus Cloacimonadaceae bacterium]|jgi:hypothetical protein